MLPTSYAIPPELISVDEYGWSGGFADVSKGKYQDRPVAIKSLRIKTRDGFDKIFKVRDHTLVLAHHSCLCSTQRLCREVLIWKRLSHPNVLPLLGVSVSKNPTYFRIISEWMPNGNVTEYVGSNQEANRLRLVGPACIPRGTLHLPRNPQLSEAASGVTYLHELGIAHGDLKGVRRYIFRSFVASLTIIGVPRRTISSLTIRGPLVWLISA